MQETKQEVMMIVSLVKNGGKFFEFIVSLIQATEREDSHCD